MSLDLRGPVNPTINEQVAATSSERNNIPLRVWSWLWPKALAVGLVILVWQIAIWTEWRPPYILPSPGEVFSRLWQEMLGNGVTDATLWQQIAKTMQRGIAGFAFAILIGTALGIAVVQWRTMRMAVGSLIAGLQTMPSIAWFPLAMMFFGLTEKAILFVVVLG